MMRQGGFKEESSFQLGLEAWLRNWWRVATESFLQSRELTVWMRTREKSNNCILTLCRMPFSFVFYCSEAGIVLHVLKMREFLF